VNFSVIDAQKKRKMPSCDKSESVVTGEKTIKANGSLAE
jgi:hypothetical protein